MSYIRPEESHIRHEFRTMQQQPTFALLIQMHWMSAAFAKFRSGDFDLSNAHHSERSIELDNDLLRPTIIDILDIESLVSRWKTVIDNDGDYIVEIKK